MLTPEVKEYIDRSVLCWLATSSSKNIPNVSPKEVFTYYAENNIIVANIASPQSVKNIKENSQICLSFIDILVQKGFQIRGKAEIISKKDIDYALMENELLKITEGKFPFSSIIKIVVENSKPIIAPKYVLYPGTTEQEQIDSARKAYKL